MNKSFIIILSFIILSFQTFSQQKEDITIEPAGSEKTLKPGSIQTIIFKVKNNSGQVLQLQPKVTLPERWKLISGLPYITINSQGISIQIISFSIPSQYPAGKYKLFLELTDLNDSGKSFGKIEREMDVDEVVDFTLEHVNSPGTVKAGEVIEASFIVRNTGNIEQVFTAIPSNCELKGNQRIKLKSGESTIVEVTSSTNKELESVNKQSFYLKIVASNNLEKQLYEHVNIIPVSQTENDLYHRFPINLTTRYLTKGRGGNLQSGYQFELKGKGSIDPEGKHQIEFLARGPNQFDLSLLGLYDEYFLQYSNENMQISVGNKAYSYTPLTESARYGIGAEARVKLNESFNSGVSYVVPRFYSKIKSVYGGFTNYTFKMDNNVALYFVRKEEIDQNHSNLFSITSSLKPFKKTSTEIEAAAGNRAGITDYALRFNLNTQVSNFYLSTNYFYAGHNFPGYYSNASFYSGSLNYQATDWWSLGLSARQDFSNAELDTLFSTAPFSRQYQMLTNFKLAQRMFLKAYYKIDEKKDRFPIPKFHYKNTSMNVNLTHRFNKLSYRLAGEYGKSINLILTDINNSKDMFRLSGNVSYLMNQDFNFSGFVSYTNVNTFIYEKQKNWIMGLTASAAISKNLTTNLHYQNTYTIEDYYRNRNLMQLNIDYQFLKRHKISLNSFYTLFQDEVDNADFTLSLSYTFNFGIPIKKVAEAGTVAGNIKNLGVDTTEGIILYLNGRSRMTDSNGDFTFKNLKPGTYSLMVDMANINMYTIFDVLMPIEVIVESNVETIVNFGLTKASKLTGNIELRQSKNISKLLDNKETKIGNVVLELFRNDESIRIISDTNGSFSFPMVRPGDWKLKVYKNGIDSQLKLEKELFDIILKPGETENLKIYVVNKKKNIIFMNNNINLSSGSQ